MEMTPTKTQEVMKKLYELDSRILKDPEVYVAIEQLEDRARLISPIIRCQCL